MRYTSPAFLAAIVLTAASCSSGSSSGGIDLEQTITVSLTPANTVPAPKATTAAGTAEFLIHPNRIDFQLSATNITAVTSAHIHSGVAGATGPVVVTLFQPPVQTAAVNGVFASGSIDATNLPVGLTLDALTTLLLSGNSYVDVHTIANPLGEIRGQIRFLGPD